METTLSFMEEDEIVEQIDALAKKRGSNRSVIIREAVRRFLEKHKE